MTALVTNASSMQADPVTLTRGVDADAQLVRHFLENRDHSVFAELIRKYERPVFRLTASVLGPGFEQAAEDLTQDIFIHVYHKLGSFRFASRFSTWLYRVAYRKAIDEKRKARYQRPHVGEVALEHMPTEGIDPQQHLLREEAHRDLRQAVEGLREPHRTAILLFYWMERPIDEIAELLDARPTTVRSYLFRARDRLRRALETRE